MSATKPTKNIMHESDSEDEEEENVKVKTVKKVEHKEEASPEKKDTQKAPIHGNYIDNSLLTALFF
jgi:hypothetical protein